MADNPISLEEVRRLQAAGADVEFEIRRVQVQELSDVTRELAKVAESIQGSDASQAISQLVQALSDLELTVQAPDMSPVFEAITGLQKQLVAMQQQPAKQAKYTFTINRDNRGRMESVIAEPG